MSLRQKIKKCCDVFTSFRVFLGFEQERADAARKHDESFVEKDLVGDRRLFPQRGRNDRDTATVGRYQGNTLGGLTGCLADCPRDDSDALADRLVSCINLWAE